MYFLVYRQFRNSANNKVWKQQNTYPSPSSKHFQFHFPPQQTLEVFWVGREYNKEADKISKTIDFDDWYTTQHLINILEQRWGKISIDRFSSNINRKSKRFNSRYL